MKLKKSIGICAATLMIMSVGGNTLAVNAKRYTHKRITRRINKRHINKYHSQKDFYLYKRLTRYIKSNQKRLKRLNKYLRRYKHGRLHRNLKHHQKQILRSIAYDKRVINKLKRRSKPRIIVKRRKRITNPKKYVDRNEATDSASIARNGNSLSSSTSISASNSASSNNNVTQSLSTSDIPNYSEDASNYINELNAASNSVSNEVDSLSAANSTERSIYSSCDLIENEYGAYGKLSNSSYINNEEVSASHAMDNDYDKLKQAWNYQETVSLAQSSAAKATTEDNAKEYEYQSKGGSGQYMYGYMVNDHIGADTDISNNKYAGAGSDNGYSEAVDIDTDQAEAGDPTPFTGLTD